MVEDLSRRTVAFAGDGCGEGELSWGQIDIWLKMVSLGQALAMGGTRPLPDGTTIDDVEDELRYLMARFQTLRTRLVFDADGWPSQIVHDRGDIELEILDVDDADPADCAAQIEARYRLAPFDYIGEWPLRMAVVRLDGRCRQLTLIVSHLAMDGAAAIIMMNDTAVRNTAPQLGIPPLEQARQQSLPGARRQHAAALRHWETQLRSVPIPMMAPSRDPRSPRHWTGRFRSTLLPRALRTAASQGGMDASPALLAAFAMAFARVTGIVVLPIRLVVSNRFRPGLADTVSPVSQPGLCVIDTSDGDYATVLRRARGAALTASKHAYYDTRDLDRVIGTVVRDRGTRINFDVGLNDRRFGGALAAVSSSHTSEFTWIGSADDPSSAFFLNIDGTANALDIMLHIDSEFMAPDDGAAILWAMEEIAVEAAAALGSA